MVTDNCDNNDKVFADFITGKTEYCITTTKCWKCGLRKGLELWRTIKSKPYWKPCKGCGYKKKFQYRKSHNMRCPACDTALVRGPDRCYETLPEHVSNPNTAYYPPRPTWICPKKKCIIHKSEGYYSYSGSLYGGIIFDVPKKYWTARFSVDEQIEKLTNKRMSKDIRLGECV